MKSILILTYKEDPHAESVCKYFNNINVKYLKVDTEKLSTDFDITFKDNNYFISGIKIDASFNIWNRRVMNVDNKKGLPKTLSEIVIDESEKTWDALLNTHKGKVVNRPYNHHHANNKIDQLIYASNRIKIPDTIVSNNPEEVKNFYAKHQGNICFKLHKGAVVEKDGDKLVVYTNKVTSEQMKNVNLVSEHPCMFQEYIDKNFEVRVTATDNEVVGIKIDSQNSETSKVDFRRYDFKNVSYKFIELPNNVKQFCSSMLKHYKLHFGEFDFINSKKNNYVFLELNPNGQWLWLEKESGYNLTKNIGDNLL